ncbi:MAG: glycosyltransferase family 4 protein [Fibromonadaceae bacterium]|jgi:glycosyltransferase involved in cell wall biosynthesis|nr:glycosyltransferase family 4 protein [Fibromonadaceae bacterium]
MKTLWVCYFVLPDFCEEFGLKRKYYGGWISGILNQLKMNYKELEIGLCFPIMDKSKMKDGELNSCKYYSFSNSSLYSIESISEIEEMTKRFETIINDFKPDIIHIWGSELPHAFAAVKACENLSMINKVILDIQALYFVYANHFYADIPEQYKALNSNNIASLDEQKNLYIEFGKLEIQLIKMIRYAFGRTDWDKACVTQINSNINYYQCNRILRSLFYEHIGGWNISNIKRHSIFISQAYYPVKGLHYLLQAMPSVLSEFPNAHIYVSGSKVSVENGKDISPYAVYLNDLIEKFGLADKITFLGPLDEELMVKQYLRSHVSVSASTIENSSNSVSEAMLLGVPIVSSYVGGICNLLRDKVDGLLYQHDAPYMLAHYICEIFGDDNLAVKFSKNASESMREIVDRKTNTEQYLKVYKNIGKEYKNGFNETDRSAFKQTALEAKC